VIVYNVKNDNDKTQSYYIGFVNYVKN
jgi:hypothetical protein